MADQSFRFFPRLPTELRLEIWRLCIPCRVWELDAPTAQGLYFDPDSDGPYPCSVKWTARLNGRPPVITRVCQESRIFAHESAGVILEDDHDPPADASWGCTTTDGYANDFWIDRKRNSAHINWHPLYQAIYQDGEGSALACIAWESRVLPGRPSIMREWFSLPCDQEAERFDVFEQVPSWWVIMRVVVIHASFREAAQSGLFGLLGGVTVQIISVSDEEKINALFAFTETSSIEVLKRDSSEVFKQELKDDISFTMGSKKLLSKMYTAYMFRLCIWRCTKPVKERL